MKTHPTGRTGDTTFRTGLRVQNPAPAHGLWSDFTSDRPFSPTSRLICFALRGLNARPFSLAGSDLVSFVHAHERIR